LKYSEISARRGKGISGSIVYFLCEGLAMSVASVLSPFAGSGVTPENRKRGERLVAYVADVVGDSAVSLQVV